MAKTTGLTKNQVEEAKKQREQQIKNMLGIAKVYEETLEPKIVLLFRRLEEMIAASQMPLIHVNIVLDILKKHLIDMADEAYVTKGTDKLMNIKGGKIG